MGGSLPPKHHIIQKQLVLKISGISPKIPLIQSHLPFMVGHLPLPHSHTYNTCFHDTPVTLVTFITLSLTRLTYM